MLRYTTHRARPGLVALYDIRPGNGAGQFLQPRSPHGAEQFLNLQFHICITLSYVFSYRTTDIICLHRAGNNPLKTLFTAVINSCCFSVNLYVVGLQKRSGKIS